MDGTNQSNGASSGISPKEWKTIGSFLILMLALSLFDSNLAKWIIGAVAVVYVIRHPGVISNPF